MSRETPGSVTAFYSVKGGSGCSTVAALAAIRRKNDGTRPVRIVDMEGDQPGLLGVPEPATPGVRDLFEGLSAGGELTRVERFFRPASENLDILARGAGLLRHAEQAAAFVDGLKRLPGDTLIDVGNVHRRGGQPVDPPDDDITVRRAVLCQADRRLLVIRACFLGLRLAARERHPPTGIVMMLEAGRPLTAGDVEDVAGSPVVLIVDICPSIARSIDAGLLSMRTPVSLSRDIKESLWSEEGEAASAEDPA